MDIAKMQARLSPSANLTDTVLAYRVPLKEMSHGVMRRDIVELLVSAFVLGPVLVQVRHRWAHPNGKYVVRIKTLTEKVTNGRYTRMWREVAFDQAETLSLADLKEAAVTVRKLEKVLAADERRRRVERERRRKLKERTMRLIGVTYDSRSRRMVEIEEFRMDEKNPNTAEMRLELVGDPKKLKRAVDALTKLGVVRGRNS